MRTYTERSIVESGAVKADDLNLDLSAVARQVNGGIGQHQAPLGGIGRAKLADLVLLNPERYENTRSTYGVANSYHRTGAGGGLGIDIDPATENLAGWQSIATLAGTSAGSVLEFDAREGMIRGAFVVEIERRTSYTKRDDGAITFPYTHRTDWTRIGIFRDGVLIADSGQIFPKRYTLDLPFATPGPSGYCRIEARFMVKTQQLIAASTVAGVTWSYPAPAEQYPHIFIHSGSGWARNQYG